MFSMPVVHHVHKPADLAIQLDVVASSMGTHDWNSQGLWIYES